MISRSHKKNKCSKQKLSGYFSKGNNPLHTTQLGGIFLRTIQAFVASWQVVSTNHKVLYLCYKRHDLQFFIVDLIFDNGQVLINVSC